MTVQQLQSGLGALAGAAPTDPLGALLARASTSFGTLNPALLRQEIDSLAHQDPQAAVTLTAALERRLTPVQLGEFRAGAEPPRVHLAQFGNGAAALPPFLLHRYSFGGVTEALVGGARDAGRGAMAGGRAALLETLVGAPSRAAEALFNRTGHPDAATLLREFRTGAGPQSRVFGPHHAFSLGFAHSETTQEHVAKALSAWKERPGGLQTQNGTLTGWRGTFVPLAPGDADASVPVKMIGTAEAHVIGSFRLDGRLMGDAAVEWTATNRMSLKSYFGENWTRSVSVSLVDNNQRPAAYGSTEQTIIWRTDLNGKIIR